MTANAATVTAPAAAVPGVRTGGPREDGPKILEHVMGWTLVMVVAMFVTQLGLL
ncbi:SCO1431 family membrane protein [Streptomyces sp. NPDC005774]|uniref:SCO1431 family membrane protein n=1 Tax=Streptomyces sp. NPDC005774 TaxID=3364728 RepID=UPI0036D1E421